MSTNQEGAGKHSGHWIVLVSMAAVTMSVAFWFALGKWDQKPLVERCRADLDLRGGLLYERSSEMPFTGVLIESYPNGGRKLAIEIRSGRVGGLSRGYDENGGLESSEQFVNGESHGLRTRWHRNGEKKSETEIVRGVVHGRHLEWHDNGRKALEAAMIDGEPDGLVMAWHPSGTLKSRVQLDRGEVVDREYYADSPLTAGITNTRTVKP